MALGLPPFRCFLDNLASEIFIYRFSWATGTMQTTGSLPKIKPGSMNS